MENMLVNRTFSQCCYTTNWCFNPFRCTRTYNLVTGLEAGTPSNARNTAADTAAKYAARANDALVYAYQKYRPPSSGGGTC